MLNDGKVGFFEAISRLNKPDIIKKIRPCFQKNFTLFKSQAMAITRMAGQVFE